MKKRRVRTVSAIAMGATKSFQVSARETRRIETFRPCAEEVRMQQRAINSIVL